MKRNLGKRLNSSLTSLRGCRHSVALRILRAEGHGALHAGDEDEAGHTDGNCTPTDRILTPGSDVPSESSTNNIASQSGAIALPDVAWKPWKIFFALGCVRILFITTLPGFVARCKAPLSNVLGQSNAVALCMLLAGLVLGKVAQVIVDNKWQDTSVGLIAIVVGTFTTMALLYNVG